MLAILDTVSAAFMSSSIVSAAQVPITLEGNKVYFFTSSTACYLAQGANPTASAGNGSAYIPAGEPIYLHGDAGAKVSVLALVVGVVTLTPVRYLMQGS